MSLAGRVVVFSITGCAFCKRAKKVLMDENVPFTDINLDKYPDRRLEMQDRSGKRTVPQIFFNSTYIGGCDDLIKLQQDGKLKDALQEVVNNPPPPDAPQPPQDDDQTDSSSFHEADGILLPSQKLGNPRECTPDEMASLAMEIRERSGLVKTHTYHLIQYKHCFVGQELVDWFIQKKGYSSRAEAVDMGKELLRRHFINHVTFEHHFEDDYLFYRFVQDLKTKALNAQLSHSCIPRNANEVADDLRKLILEIYGDFLSPDGHAVDYEGIACSPKFETYVRLSAELKRVDLSQLLPPQKIAFFVNVYNALVIHAFVVQGPPTNMLARLRFFYQISYVIGGQVFSLNDIESGVLRANRKPVGAFRRPFSRQDPRLPVALSAPEPRVHFALVCGAKSCPPIKTYSPQNIFEQLDVATESFLEEGGACLVDMERREVRLSTILKWYKEDFGSNKHEILGWVAEHLPDGEKKKNIKQLLQERNYTVKFLTYNWGLNSA